MMMTMMMMERLCERGQGEMGQMNGIEGEEADCWG